MGLTRGTNCGFVSTRPTSDPAATNVVIDSVAFCMRDTSPAAALKVTEIGWWCDNATEASNFEVAIYDNDGSPNIIIGSDKTNAKGTTSGWKYTAVDIAISASTVYWIGVQVDDTATATNTNYQNTGVDKRETQTGVSTLTDPWSGGSATNYAMAIYAVVELAGTNTQINIGDVWKDVNSIQINIGDVWKTVTTVEINIGDVWKTVYSA